MTMQHWVLVDYENVQAVELDLIARLPVHVVLFVGPHQRLLPLELFKKALAMKELLEVVESAGAGKNALDFQMAFQAGRIAERHPEASIHFVTKDTGFDVLVKHMQAEKRLADRAVSFASLKFLPGREGFKAMPLHERTVYVVERLGRQTSKTWPRTRKTLLSSMSAFFKKELNASSVEKVLKALIADGKVTIGEKDEITYSLNGPIADVPARPPAKPLPAKESPGPTARAKPKIERKPHQREFFADCALPSP